MSASKEPRARPALVKDTAHSPWLYALCLAQYGGCAVQSAPGCRDRLDAEYRLGIVVEGR
jgi:hypothetical protein